MRQFALYLLLSLQWGSTALAELRSHRTWLAAISLALLLSACVAHRYTPMEPVQSPIANAEADVIFSYQQPVKFSPLEQLAEYQDKRYQGFQFSYPSAGDNGQSGHQVTIEYHRSRAGGCRDTAIILPIWGSYTYPSERMVHAIKKYSGGEIDVLHFIGREHLIDWEGMAVAESEQHFWRLVDMQVKRVRNTVIDLRRLLDWVEMQPSLRCGKQLSIGFSISALISGIVLSHEPRLESGVLVMGGGNPGEIAANCPGRAAAMREQALPRFGWSEDYFEREFSRRFEAVNPSRFKHRRDPSTVLFIDAKDDRCMPQASRDSLWRALGKPERYTFSYGHKISFLAMTPLALNFLRHRIYRFMQDQFRSIPR